MVQKRSKRISTFGARLTSVISVSLVLLLLGIASLVGITAKSLNDDVRRNVGFVVKMKRDCSVDEINKIKTMILASPAVEQFTYFSPEEILRQESDFLGEGFADGLDENPYAPEFDIKVRPSYSSPDSIAALSDDFSLLWGVDDVLTENAVIEGVDSFLRRSGIILLGIAVVLLAVSLALINNTVSLSIYSRRFVIHTMKLVGATRAFIRRPFVLAGVVNGLVAACIASVFIIALRMYASTVDSIVDSVLSWPIVACVCGGVVVLGIAVCALTSAFATNRYLNASYDEIYLK